MVVVSEGVSGNAGSTYETKKEDIYDLAFDGTSVVALYKTGNIFLLLRLWLM